VALTFNADEALGMAEQIERNGRQFYLRAAEIAQEGDVNKLLVDLAEWEQGHEALFAAMRADLTDEEKRAATFDPDGEAALYLEAMADTHVFNVQQDPQAVLAGDESPQQILDTALGFERDSILFFMGLAKMVPERLGRDKVEGIAREEVSHVAYLKRQLKKLEAR